MFRIRLHGRGGQGIKTAGRILGSAFFQSGFEVQDAPRYGAERRGAPIFSYVRASHRQIRERSSVRNPDLVILGDDTLAGLPSAGVLEGKKDSTVFLIRSRESSKLWRERLGIRGPVIILPIQNEESEETSFSLSLAAGAGALCGVLEIDAILDAVKKELAGLEKNRLEKNLDIAAKTFDSLSELSGIVSESPDLPLYSEKRIHWANLENDGASAASPGVHASQTSVLIRTGLWRSHRPVVDLQKCHGCVWICSSFCPDSAISLLNGKPKIDYNHCKGCMICPAVCPNHAIDIVPEIREGEAP